MRTYMEVLPADESAALTMAHKSNPLYDSNEMLGSLGRAAAAQVGAKLEPLPPAQHGAGGGGSRKKRKSSALSGGGRGRKPAAAKPVPGTASPPLAASAMSTASSISMDEDHFAVPDVGPDPEVAPQLMFRSNASAAGHIQCYDGNHRQIHQPEMTVEARKGFVYSAFDNAFVCQKKNHFEVVVTVSSFEPAMLQIGSNLYPITQLAIGIVGKKLGSPGAEVVIERSAQDRSRHVLDMLPIDTRGGQRTSLTASRLHFSETTANNIRKRGKPNPEQRFFMLEVSLVATANGTPFMLASQQSQRIVVRASNPSQFENDAIAQWHRGKVPNSTVTTGPVGINTSAPSEALSVHGNVQVTGTVMTPSDRRVKEHFEPTDTAQQLANIQDLSLYRYDLKQPWLAASGQAKADGSGRSETGVVAQELRAVMPDAVVPTGNTIVMDNGEVIEDLLVIDKTRIFMENVGAVQELSKMTANLDSRIQELEALNAAVRSGTYRRKGGAGATSRRASEHSDSPYLVYADSTSSVARRLKMGLLVTIAVLTASAIAVGAAVLAGDEDRDLPSTERLTVYAPGAGAPPPSASLPAAGLFQAGCAGSCGSGAYCRGIQCACISDGAKATAAGCNTTADCGTSACQLPGCGCEIGGPKCRTGWSGSTCATADAQINTYLLDVLATWKNWGAGIIPLLTQGHPTSTLTASGARDPGAPPPPLNPPPCRPGWRTKYPRLCRLLSRSSPWTSVALAPTLAGDSIPPFTARAAPILACKRPSQWTSNTRMAALTSKSFRAWWPSCGFCSNRRPAAAATTPLTGSPCLAATAEPLAQPQSTGCAPRPNRTAPR